VVVKKKAIFFDRDGVLNDNIYYKKYKHFEAPLRSQDLKINKKINFLKDISKKYLIFIITNQPAAAKKKTSFLELENIKKKFLNTLKKKKINIDEYLHCYNDYITKTNYCKNFRYCKFRLKNKTTNICKKPSNHLIEYCIKKYNINRTDSIFIGDRTTDMIAAKKSKLNFIFLRNNSNKDVPLKKNIKIIRNINEICLI
jgi:D-glycero-D-manno-heptose 1,7-bisphosphate phosphatase